MLTKDAVDFQHAHIFDEIKDEVITPPVVTFTYVRRAEFTLLPKKIQRLIQDNQYGVIDKRQAARLRDDPRSQFWINEKTWRKVSYNSYKNTAQGLAVYPKEPVNTTKFSSSGGANATPDYSVSEHFLSDSQQAGFLATPALLNSQYGEGQAKYIAQSMQQHSRTSKPTVVEIHLPAVCIYKPVLQSTVQLKASHQVRQSFSTHLLQASETVEQLAQQYTGYKNANLIYDYNLGFSSRKPATSGTSLRVPDGWKLNIEGSSSNSRTVVIKWQGPTNGQVTLQLDKKRPDEVSFWQHYFSVKPGVYTVVVTASGAVDTTTFTVEQPTLAYEIELLDEAGAPQANMGYKIRLRNGHVITGQLDQNGYANVSGPDFENAKVSFFELADHDWSVGHIT
ncbi:MULTISPECIES: DUF4397 domain-containing protein [Pseudoalteromonas]|uniref:DUF4397 domain-containing protein n=1 Tax=Pseudoalteromonas TaxID=53246 RepID=UPI000305D736|nr:MULTISPECIES: DUF4397 domain-containing protein [Pseudoalteromonas]MCF6145746.1 hypothetical protein [Pseudoalteromonas mariniglutinosa NCIMB 1770]